MFKKLLLKHKFPFYLNIFLTIYKTPKPKLDWHNNTDITGKINIEVGDAMYDLLDDFNIGSDMQKIDEIIEECLKIAILKYK